MNNSDNDERRQKIQKSENEAFYKYCNLWDLVPFDLEPQLPGPLEGRSLIT
jgi:hypothetical protein